MYSEVTETGPEVIREWYFSRFEIFGGDLHLLRMWFSYISECLAAEDLRKLM